MRSHWIQPICRKNVLTLIFTDRLKNLGYCRKLLLILLYLISENCFPQHKRGIAFEEFFWSIGSYSSYNAMKQFSNLEKKLANNKTFMAIYMNFMKEYCDIVVSRKWIIMNHTTFSMVSRDIQVISYFYVCRCRENEQNGTN